MTRCFILMLVAWTGIACAQSPATQPTTQPVPSVALRYGSLKALIYTPDAKAGHYRGTRFDWSGMIGRIESDGHVFWDEWNASEDATGDHDNAVGPALEFGMNAPLGFEDAKPGEGFVKIGVGVLKKPEDGKPYFFRRKYDILDRGNWSVTEKGDGKAITFKQSVTLGEWGYEYTKSVVLMSDSSLLVECRLTNTGKRPVVTDVYNHNFLRPDARGFEPPIEISFDRSVTLDPKAKLAGSAEMGRTFKVTQPLTKNVWAPLVFGEAGAPRMFELTKGELSMTVTHDFVPSKYVLYGLPHFISVEPFMDINLEPGESVSWSYGYAFSLIR